MSDVSSLTMAETFVRPFASKAASPPLPLAPALLWQAGAAAACAVTRD